MTASEEAWSEAKCAGRLMRITGGLAWARIKSESELTAMVSMYLEPWACLIAQPIKGWVSPVDLFW